MAFVTTLLEPLQPQLALQELVLLIPQPQQMLPAQHGNHLVFGLEQQDARTLQIVQGLLELLTHAQHLLQVMDHAQELDQQQQLVFQILQFVIKPQHHSPHTLNARHGTLVA